MAGPLDLITLPPRLTVRALDDLHAIATVARQLSSQLHHLESLETSARQMVELGERIDRRAETMVELGERVVALGASVNDLGERMLPEATLVHETAREIVRQTDELMRVLPLVERALQATQPFEGAVERLGRLADRLSGSAGAPGPRSLPSDPAS